MSNVVGAEGGREGGRGRSVWDGWMFQCPL